MFSCRLFCVTNLLPYDLIEVCKLTFALAISGWLLGLVFILISYAISLCVSTKAQALAALLLIWLVSVLLYDLGLLIFTIAFEGKITNELMNICLMINPSTLFRLLNHDLIEAQVPSRNALLMGMYLCIWFVVFFLIDRWLLVRRTY